MSDIGFAKNYTNLYEINITPDGPEKTWARVAAGINSADWNGNEKTAQDDYYDGDGLGNTEVGGGQIIGTFSGHRKYGDPAQDFIASKMLDYQGRHTDFRWTSPDGSVPEGDVTLVNIDPQGGDPTSKSDFGFEVHYNGLPTYVPGDATTFPETVTAAAVTVAEGGTRDRLQRRRVRHRGRRNRHRGLGGPRQGRGRGHHEDQREVRREAHGAGHGGGDGHGSLGVCDTPG